MINFALNSFQCLTQGFEIDGENVLQAMVLKPFGSGQRRIFFESEQMLFRCVTQVRLSQNFDDLLSEYNELSFLGKGGFGKVVLAQHKNNFSKVAIKLIDKNRLTKVYSKCDEVF